MFRSLSTSDLHREARRIELEMKLVHKQIAIAEKCLSGLLKDFSNLAVDMTRLHGRNKELSSMLEEFAVEESPSLRDALVQIADCISIVADSLITHIHAVQYKVIHPMSAYSNNCKLAREELDLCSDAKNKQDVALRNLENIGRKAKASSPCKRDDQETVLSTANQIRSLEERMKTFERNKAEDVRLWLSVYLYSSLAYHVRAVEEYTKAYQALNAINVEAHVENFVERLTPSNKNERLSFVRWNSLSSINSPKND